MSMAPFNLIENTNPPSQKGHLQCLCQAVGMFRTPDFGQMLSFSSDSMFLWLSVKFDHGNQTFLDLFFFLTFTRFCGSELVTNGMTWLGCHEAVVKLPGRWMGADVRRTFLLQDRGFRCLCVRCRSPEAQIFGRVFVGPNSAKSLSEVALGGE